MHYDTWLESDLQQPTGTFIKMQCWECYKVLLWSDTAIFGGPAVFSTNRKHTARTMYDKTNFRLLALYPFLR